MLRHGTRAVTGVTSPAPSCLRCVRCRLRPSGPREMPSGSLPLLPPRSDNTSARIPSVFLCELGIVDEPGAAKHHAAGHMVCQPPKFCHPASQNGPCSFLHIIDSVGTILPVKDLLQVETFQGRILSESSEVASIISLTGCSIHSHKTA